MFVLTVDQQRSTSRGDAVPDLIGHLEPLVRRLPGVRLPLERTVGDEVQMVLTDPRSTLMIVLEILRVGGWWIGLGIGAVNDPLPEHSREASGPAFVRARAAVERAKTKAASVPLAVVGGGGAVERTADVEALLRLLGAIVERRTPHGWEVTDLLRPADVRTDGGGEPPLTQREIARILGISEQAVSQRVRTTLWAEEVAAWPLATRLLQEADTWDQA
ncbi:Sigma-70, region 4 [Sanguibacter gelidistatuariae]|uniref:Sigma-70, region 4 n=1 Tax=Sanguibacter gelidistatuariae TaxID=1814289 RepID=A0A1G6JQH8_9MICO|nr:sigma factor-like helix-turn-helix DNA-binding protein [Sanguibacter gelidistatuariae]SDC20236.1 Sigma-70, region 4 [Sanguibacter gelidistatuariae]